MSNTPAPTFWKISWGDIWRMGATGAAPAATTVFGAAETVPGAVDGLAVKCHVPKPAAAIPTTAAAIPTPSATQAIGFAREADWESVNLAPHFKQNCDVSGNSAWHLGQNICLLHVEKGWNRLITYSQISPGGY